MNLTTLVLRPEDKWPTQSGVRPSAKWTDLHSRLEDEDKERARAMIYECGFTQTTVMPNFDARLRTGLPPTGYAATWHEDSVFVADAFDANAFRGVAGVSLGKTKVVMSSLGDVFADLNALLGDASPVPLVGRTQKGNWVCSLGAFGWVGLYHQAHPKPPYVAVVVAGLDQQSWDACRLEMREMHRRVKVREAHERLGFWREVARQNRARVLATFLRVLGDKPKDVGKLTETPVAYEARAQTQAANGLEWFRTSGVRVPDWFVFPSAAPRGCSALPTEPGVGVRTDHTRNESKPWEVSPEFDVVVDDLAVYGEREYVRLAGCCDTRQKARVLLKGPLHEMLLFEGPGESNPESLSAFPAQAAQRPILSEACEGGANEEDDDVTCTWEDAALGSNRLVRSLYVFSTVETEAALGAQAAQRLMPIRVRVSCRDSMGRAEPDEALRANRLASLALDEWVPIHR